MSWPLAWRCSRRGLGGGQVSERHRVIEQLAAQRLREPLDLAEVIACA
jgi:hypothetical protein